MYDSDSTAAHFIEFGKMARDMPPSFEAGGGVSYPVDAPEGGRLGLLLPGRGFLSAVDLKTLGITKNPPNVYDPSTYKHLLDEARTGWKRRGVLADDGEDVTITDRRGREHALIQGAAISTYDQIIAQRAGGFANDIAFQKASATTIANNWHLIWKVAGNPVGGTYSPTTTAPTDALMDRSGAAAISLYLSNPSGTNKKYLLTFGFSATSQINMGVLIDILSMSGSFRLTVATAETITTPTNATREYGSGTGNGNLYTFIVATAGTSSASAHTFIAHYMNQASTDTTAPTLTGVTSQTLTADTIYLSGAGILSNSFFGPLASGDTGVRAIKSSTVSVAATSAILEGIVFFPLSFLPGIAANSYIERDSTTQIDGITELINASGVIGHLSLIVLPNTTTSGVITGYLKTVSG